tara:strand:- start:12535 stop:13086 length:552 start_codon:yes stop_codon:yes gene_type:complete
MLPQSKDRKKIHIRKIHCEGYKRKDGLWDIEGHLKDTKTYNFKSDYRGNVNAGTAVHNMSIRITMNDNLTIKEIYVDMDSHPYKTCPAIVPNFKKLIGVTIGKGFRKNVYSKVGGIQGCTHLVELLFPIATTAFQTIYSYKALKKTEQKQNDEPKLINSCHSWREDGEVIQKYFPEFYKDKIL